VQNALAGLDHLLHGEANLRGWGLASRSDPTLLRPVGFDAVDDRFVYEVNERFGQSLGGGMGRRGGRAGAGLDPSRILDRMLANPLPVLLELAGVLRDAQPPLQSGREAISKALEETRTVLTKRQWDELPEALKNPFRGGGRRPGG